MASPAHRAGGKRVPSWLLRDDASQVGDVAAACEAAGISVLVLVRFRAALKTKDLESGHVELRESDRAEVSTWVIVEGDAERGS